MIIEDDITCSLTASPRLLKIGYVISALSLAFLLLVVPSIVRQVWPQIVEISSWIGDVKLWAFVLVGGCTNVAALFLNNLFYLSVYCSGLPFFQQFKINPLTPWPWQTNPTWGKSKFLPTLCLVLFNAVVVSLLVVLIQSYIHDLTYRHEVDLWPTHIQVLIQFLVFFLYNEVVSYLAHYLFHSALLYRFHKLHHSYRTTISLTATYAHPIEYVFSNLASTFLCIPLLSTVASVHIVTIVPWLYFRLTETIDVHSGYQFPWGCITFMPGRNLAGFHDFHHLSNSSTYGSMMCWMDGEMGTDADYRKHRGKGNKKL